MKTSYLIAFFSSKYKYLGEKRKLFVENYLKFVEDSILGNVPLSETKVTSMDMKEITIF